MGSLGATGSSVLLYPTLGLEAHDPPLCPPLSFPSVEGMKLAGSVCCNAPEKSQQRGLGNEWEAKLTDPTLFSLVMALLED